MRGLTIIVADPSPERFRTALAMAAAQAALGGRAHIFCQNEAVALLRPPISGPNDAAHAAAGLPTLNDLFAEALAFGVAVTACQSGLALAGIDAHRLDGRIACGGLVGVMQGLADNRLVVI